MRGHRLHSTGFTLIEVLVALVIVAVALAAAMRAVGGVTEASSAVETRLYAQWSAENRLAELRLQRAWPELGSRGFACPQGALALYCEETAIGTANPAFRRVEIAVYATSDKAVRLAWLVHVVPDVSRNVL